MKRSTITAVLAAAISLVLTLGVSAQATATDPETTITQVADSLDSSGANAQGAAAIISAIEAEFNVTADQITALRNDNLGYGEIVILLALAQTMPGGVTQANIDAVLADRQGPPAVGWGKIAKDLGLNMGSVVSSVARTRDQSSQGAGHSQGTAGGSGKGAVGAANGAGGSTGKKP